MPGFKILSIMAATSSVVFAAHGCGEVNVVYTGLPGRHKYVKEQGAHPVLTEKRIADHMREMREAGYNVRGIWRGPEINGSEFAEHVTNFEWHAAGVGFGIRGSNISELTRLFEENLATYREQAPDAKFVFNYSPLSFLWSVQRYFPLSSDCKDHPGKDLGSITLCDEACN
ncbi:hypothetical protein FLAG1_09301 [Fusarium langsethiae]|uniref:Uncharacterized protein n=1 Tax=Fusarium langsethiae TaxID=179993 RepID=A0A0N0DC89_FUSLA|nr:hypothetical protein FLAG1_09301 [Fusarium langsethiae]GKU08334.1 unnamed protein product [Fusarium langsethiae]